MTLVRMPRAWGSRSQAGKAFGTSYLSVFPVTHTLGVLETRKPTDASSWEGCWKLSVPSELHVIRP